MAMDTPEPKTNLGRPWQPGQSGNPGGRRKTKPLTDLLKVELQKPAKGKSGLTKGQKLIERLVGIALSGKRGESIQAMRLLFAYSDGLPDQTVELDVYDAARRIAQERGLDPDRVVTIFDAVKSKRRAG